MAPAPDPQPGILDIALYEGGASSLAGHLDVLKLSSNENPYGPSPAAVQAMKDAAASMHRYPSSDHRSLRAAIGRAHGVDPERVICGAGSDEIIAFLCQAYAGVGDEVIHTRHGFALYRLCAQAVGARPVEVTERDRCVDVDAILSAVTGKTRLVFVTNPTNPAATVLDDDALSHLAGSLPDHVLLVLDGAYAEFAEGCDGGASLVDARDDVVMLRTFSKLYGLGGLRVGWAYAAQEIIDVLNRVRGPFNLSSVALAGAEAAMRDRDFVEKCLRDNAEQRLRLVGGLHQLGIACDDSRANFVLARFGSEEMAGAADAQLQSAGILVRRVKGYGFPEALRITVGSAEDVSRVLAALTEFKGSV